MNKKWIYYLTAFFSGTSVMAIELGASRLLAPYFSSSQIVWTIIIGTIMIAMAIGNVIGGKMADKYESPTRLFIWLFIAATFTMLIPLFGKFVISGVALILATFVTKNYLIWAALVSCLFVFVFPLLVLGMVTPNLVKFAVKDIKENGKTVGIIEACNTIGSIIGTFFPTFVTIPTLGTTLTFVVFASVLYAICLIYFIYKRKHVIKTTVITAVALVLGISSNLIGTAFWKNNVVYEGESVYNYLRVEETNDSIILSTNVLFGVQSIKKKNGSLTGMYYDYALMAPIMAGGLERSISICILGLGTGTFGEECLKRFNVSSIDGVEIDGKIIDIAYKYFDLPEKINTIEADGRAYIDSTSKKYDVIMVDAYRDITIPFQMSSKEFFISVKNHLTPNGVMVINMNMRSNEKDAINDYLSSTVKSCFSSVYTCNAGGNVELFASNNFDVKNALSNNFKKLSDYNFKNFAFSVLNRLEAVEETNYLLTDDKAPVEVLGMKVLDEIIMEELSEVKQIIKGKNLKELIDMIFSGKFNF
ncbi:MAG: fused MFS/spermidine synthase [Clostridia bacterium]|nr:fused MFS/spermidine synthase [Clostridia bacterium]